jgi:hypothetical protein
MEIFRSGKPLGEQTGANPGLIIWRCYEAPVRLVREQQLRGTPDHNWVDTAAHHGKKDGRNNCDSNLSKK